MGGPSNNIRESSGLCRIDDTFSVQGGGKLNSHEGDACLEETPFLPVSSELVEDLTEHPPVTVDYATWYANGCQWRPAINEEIFNTYDYTVALGDDLRRQFPTGSLVRITSQETGNEIIARVTDRKTFETGMMGVDMSKVCAFALSGGNYELIRNGRTSVMLQPVRLKVDDDRFSGANIYFRLGMWRYDPANSNKYGEAIAHLWDLAHHIKGVDGYKGWPRPYLVVTHGVGRFDGDKFVELRFGHFRSEEELEKYYREIQKFTSASEREGLAITELSEMWPRDPVNGTPRYTYPDGYLETAAGKRLPPNGKCIFRPFMPTAEAKDMLRTLGAAPDAFKFTANPSNPASPTYLIVGAAKYIGTTQPYFDAYDLMELVNRSYPDAVICNW